MSSQAPMLLLDTNVWLDNYDGARRARGHSGELIDRACAGGAVLLYAVSSMKDVYYLVASQMKARAREASGALTQEDAAVAEMYARSCVDNMGELGTAVAVDLADVWLAQKFQRIHPDFEDCLVMAAAQRAGADYVVTSDKRFLRQSAVPTLSPKEALALMDP